MSTVVDPFIKRLQKIEDDLPRIANRAVLDNAEVILGILKEDQLSFGEDSFGKVIRKKGSTKYTGYYSQYSEELYKSQGANKPKRKGERYNMDWSGSLFESLNIKSNTQKKEFNIFSANGKIEMLEEFYGTKLSKLTEQNNYYINMEIILPRLQEYLLEESVKGLI